MAAEGMTLPPPPSPPVSGGSYQEMSLDSASHEPPAPCPELWETPKARGNWEQADGEDPAPPEAPGQGLATSCQQGVATTGQAAPAPGSPVATLSPEPSHLRQEGPGEGPGGATAYDPPSTPAGAGAQGQVTELGGTREPEQAAEPEPHGTGEPGAGAVNPAGHPEPAGTKEPEPGAADPATALEPAGTREPEPGAVDLIGPPEPPGTRDSEPANSTGPEPGAVDPASASEPDGTKAPESAGTDNPSGCPEPAGPPAPAETRQSEPGATDPSGPPKPARTREPEPDGAADPSSHPEPAGTREPEPGAADPASAPEPAGTPNPTGSLESARTREAEPSATDLSGPPEPAGTREPESSVVDPVGAPEPVGTKEPDLAETPQLSNLPEPADTRVPEPASAPEPVGTKEPEPGATDPASTPELAGTPQTANPSDLTGTTDPARPPQPTDPPEPASTREPESGSATHLLPRGGPVPAPIAQSLAASQESSSASPAGSSTSPMSSSVATSMEPETPIEREIRWLQEREEVLRRERGLTSPRGAQELVEVRIRPLLSQPALVLRPSDTERRWAGAQMLREIEREARREQALVRLGTVLGAYDPGPAPGMLQKKMLFEASPWEPEGLFLGNQVHWQPEGVSTSTRTTWQPEGTSPGNRGPEEISPGNQVSWQHNGIFTGNQGPGAKANMVILEPGTLLRPGGPPGTPRGPFARLHPRSPPSLLEQEVREAREREQELRRQRQVLYGTTTPRDEDEGHEDAQETPPQQAERVSCGKLDVTWPPPSPAEPLQLNGLDQANRSPRSLRQKNALIQRWESGSLGNPENPE
ncbi:uncharacterized protein MISP3 [Alligator sinensis]|uniref:Uncharacterized protein MISP3 n=1 Tax=Alligator sinensis TaxID=38654 RepID=A0A1U7RHD7_ALLSI|nr:uncharacterized protein MISP3 [Alligator sinensis]XP_025059760.1 uncharacterized protein MISP3 [Alligator sinensis]